MQRAAHLKDTRGIMTYRALSSLLLLSLGCAAEPRATEIEGGVSAEDSGVIVDAGRDGGVVVRPDAGSDAAANHDASDTCEEDTFVAELEPSALMFQIDTSRSMNCPITEPGCLSEDPTSAPDDSRWDVFRSKLEGVLDKLPDALAAGLMHYPNPSSGCAPESPLVAVGALFGTRAMIRTQLMGLEPDYITPTRDAVRAALAQLRARTESGRYLVLATDGAASVCLGCDASCADFGKVPDSENDGLVADVAAALAQDGIRTFVIGVPGSQGYRSVLSRVAEMGGTARAGCTSSGPAYCHYDLTDATVDFGVLLAQALSEIGGKVLSCDFAVPTTNTFDPNKVNVSLTQSNMRTDLKRDTAQTNGWDYIEGGKTIRLFGAACDLAKQLTNGKVDIVYGCPTIL
jgi:hypothetical protein